MRRMSALSPKMQELRDKYKDDPTRMNQEVMKLYKDYGINPVSGCLPMMIQIPIFFGLFTMLRQAVELRNASFLWVHDLSQPDTDRCTFPVLGWPINILPLLMAANERLADANDAEDRRHHAAARHDVHADDFCSFLLQFRGGAGIILHNAEPVHDSAALPEPEPTGAGSGESCAAQGRNRAKDDDDAQGITRHDSRLSRFRRGDRRETQSEGGNPTLQIYMEESRTLIGRDGETLEAIQFLLNRLIQAKDKDAPKVIVDCEHYRSMREDRIVQRVRELAERVRITGRSLAARADEFLRAPHRAQRFQGRSRCRDLEPVGFRADQADHTVKRQAKKETAEQELSKKTTVYAATTGRIPLPVWPRY